LATEIRYIPSVQNASNYYHYQRARAVHAEVYGSVLPMSYCTYHVNNHTNRLVVGRCRINDSGLMGPGAYQFRGKLAKLNASLKRTERLTRRRHRQRFAGASSTWRWRRQVSSQDRRLPGRRTCQRAEDRRQGPRGCWVLGDGRV